MEAYRLEKAIWDDGDFERMGWHDCTIWSMLAEAESYEYALDLDYIFEWVHPGEGETYFRFWVAPVTMVFENAYSVLIDIESDQGMIVVLGLYREDPSPTPNGRFIQHRYRFDCLQGEISLTATGYEMYVRATPKLLQRQRLGLDERNGISFGRGIGAA